MLSVQHCFLWNYSYNKLPGIQRWGAGREELFGSVTSHFFIIWILCMYVYIYI